MSKEHAPERSTPAWSSDDVDEAMLRPPLPHQLYRFADLKRRRIVTSRAQLQKMIARDGFPPGFILTPQTRAWRAEAVEQWLANRPTGQIAARGRAKALAEGTVRPPVRTKKVEARP